MTTLSDNKMLFCLRLEERPEVCRSLGSPEEGGGELDSARLLLEEDNFSLHRDMALNDTES